MIESTDLTKRAELPSLRRTAARFLARFGPLPFLIVPSILIFAWGNPRFVGEANIVNMLQQGVYLLLAAVAQLLVLIAGGFDLSVGSNIALTSIVSSSLMVTVQQAYPDAAWLAVLVGLGATLGVGAFAGICNAAGVALLKVNPFIVTLATASIFQGLTLLISQGLQIEGLPEPFVEVLGAGFVWQIPVPALIAIPIVLFFLCPDELDPLRPQPLRHRLQSQGGADRRHFCAASSVRHIPLLRGSGGDHGFSADGPRVVGRALAGRRISASIHYRRGDRRLLLAWREGHRRRRRSGRRVRHHSRQRHGSAAPRFELPDDHSRCRADRRRRSGSVSRCMTPKLKARPQPLRRFECIEAIVRRVAGL
jgi:Branched-chain amino acid transport system / permease component